MKKNKKNEIKNLIKYLFETGSLMRVERSGWKIAKIDQPESVAEHSHHMAVIAFTLAKLEKKKNAHEITTVALFHDLIETRIQDKHKIASRYMPTPKEVNEKIMKDQFSLLPAKISEEVQSLIVKTYKKERAILKDADYLQTAFRAKEYYDIGYKDALSWIERIGKVLKTKSAKQIYKQLVKTNSNCWWQGLKIDVKELKY